MVEEKLLGDMIEEQLKKVKVDKVIDAIAQQAGKDDCGCKKRKLQLNKLHKRLKGK